MTSYVQWAVTGLWDLVQGHAGPQPVALPKTPPAVFKENLSKIAALDDASGQKELINDCVKAIDNDLAAFDFTFSEQAQNTLEGHLIAFDSAVDQTPHLNQIEANHLKNAFRQSSADAIKELWVSAAVQSFYPILFLSDSEEWVLAAQKWTQQFLKGASYLERLNSDALLDRDSIKGMTKYTQHTFSKYYWDTINKKAESMIKLANENHTLFQKGLIDNKKKKESFECLSIAVAVVQDIKTGEPALHCAIFPDTRAKLLGDCVAHGSDLQASDHSITESKESLQRFVNLFAEQETFEKEFIFQNTSFLEIL